MPVKGDRWWFMYLKLISLQRYQVFRHFMFMESDKYFKIHWNYFMNSKKVVYKVRQFTVVLLPCYRNTRFFQLRENCSLYYLLSLTANSGFVILNSRTHYFVPFACVYETIFRERHNNAKLNLKKRGSNTSLFHKKSCFAEALAGTWNEN